MRFVNVQHDLRVLMECLHIYKTAGSTALPPPPLPRTSPTSPTSTTVVPPLPMRLVSSTEDDLWEDWLTSPHLPEPTVTQSWPGAGSDRRTDDEQLHARLPTRRLRPPHAKPRVSWSEELVRSPSLSLSPNQTPPLTLTQTR